MTAARSRHGGLPSILRRSLGESRGRQRRHRGLVKQIGWVDILLLRLLLLRRGRRLRLRRMWMLMLGMRLQLRLRLRVWLRLLVI